MSVLVSLIVMLGMLVVVPAGLRLIDAAELTPIRRTWPVFAVPGAVALWLPRSARFTRGLLAVSAAVLVATMVLALSWALGEATGLPHPNLTWMAATHGLGNALGFALCSVLAWRRLKEKAA
ncbi:YndJ family transporter [Streptomyces lunaelactis]|uniref:YndJ family transporter n=1 Tax=Streptomyces lunaelactis TaxID=1535768 RepID=UPI001584DAC5|nr:YndJ family transporter [Streptomyces lunaelactis]NUK13023.1 YndJ family transporter [Streptomyces lunaelactis]NUK32925.1 YndJ family transporter [Streptomyces lunaelactis]NUK40253.1 YndJ family transporter [Streptomyces lunaelactis]NUK50169.1 YndJ family transporter [Streptomyces lunaelactis]NUK64529.1 YndJ family transporter [Streptomyces lunaelactis]